MGGGGQQSSSQSGWGQSYNTADSDSFSRGINGSQGMATSSSLGGTSQAVFGPQADALGGLYGDIAGFNLGGMGRAAGGQAGRSAGDLRGAMQGLQGLADPRSQIKAQEQSLQAGLSNLFNNTVMPGIQGDAIGAGGFGGGRQGVAEGMAAGQLGSAYASGLGDITARANSQALQANMAIPGIAQAQMSNRLSPFSTQLDALQRLSSSIGGPTVLSQSFNQGGSTSLNSSFGRTRSGSSSTVRGQSESGSKGQASGWDFNIL